MKTQELNTNRMESVNGGVKIHTTAEAREKIRQRMWFEQEKQRLEEIAARRIQASEDALLAAARARHAEE